MKPFLIAILVIITKSLIAQHNMKSRWADSIQQANILPEYPRPQLVRTGNWINLNGKWSFQIKGGDGKHQSRDGAITVPFPIESLLSGVREALLPTEELVYRRTVNFRRSHMSNRVLLHFGAVDNECTIFVNGQLVGSHTGGYDSFEIDITDAFKDGTNEIAVTVKDATDTGDAPHGKQTLNPRWIRYTAVSGIWQTVWLEEVPAVYISSLKITPDLDKGGVQLTIVTNVQQHISADVTISDQQGKEVGATQLHTRTPASSFLPIKDLHPWSPESPYLYSVYIRLQEKGKTLDEVKSYCALRKISVAKDTTGVERIFLNNQPYYNLGVLDQGYWPDGLYTAPSDNALAFDIETIKAMGFNTIRKHIKREPERWYYHCDRMGMLVWQDMPSWRQNRTMNDTAKNNFLTEALRHVEQLYNHPSVISWVIFNENWGSFDQEKITLLFKKTDPTRLINGHSGPFVNQIWDHADVTDIHLYPYPAMPPYEQGKAMVCGEFGGVFLPIKGHEWIEGKGWGHNVPPGKTLLQRYTEMTDHLVLLQQEGLSGSIFTQPFDVEIEENGLLTYDRAIFKVPIDSIKQQNLRLVGHN